MKAIISALTVPSEFSMILALWPSIIATAELVVPESDRSVAIQKNFQPAVKG